VPGTGLEPARLAALDPKSSASANSAIPASNKVLEKIISIDLSGTLRTWHRD
jgi:hypothetical protein